jgi:hypothetical protein
MRVVNLFTDMTHEGGASINGQFLGSLGASAAAITIVALVRPWTPICLFRCRDPVQIVYRQQ